jgi:hypothetical protein
MPTPGKGSVAQFIYAQFYKRYNSKAYGILANPAAITAPVTSHAYLVRDPVTATMPQVQRAINEFLGGRGILGQMTGGVESMGQIQVDFANLDANIMTMANKSKIDTTTVANWAMFSPNHANPVLQQMGAIFTARFQSREAGSDGDNYYLNFFLPNFEMELDLASFTREGGRNVSPGRGVIRPSFSGKFPNGVAFGTNQGYKDNMTDYFYAVTEHPIGLTFHVADLDAEAGGFNLGYLPVKSTVTGGNTDNWFTKDSVASAPTSVSTTTGAVVLPATAANEQWHSLYLTEFDAIPA